MTRTLSGTLALTSLLALASCGPAEEPAEPADDVVAGGGSPSRIVLRLELTNEGPEADPKLTTVDLVAPPDWQDLDSFAGTWSQPDSAPTLMLVASGHDDERRAGEYEARRTGEGIGVNLQPTWADNNVTLSFVMGDAEGEGRWGHSTIAGHQEKGPVRVRVVEP